MDPTDVAERIAAARAACAEHHVDALFVSPGSDLRYLTGYEATPLERLTCLVLGPDLEPFLVVPALEEAAAAASPVARTGAAELVSWQETQDPYEQIARRLPDVERCAVDDRMWAQKALALRDALPGAEQRAAELILSDLRAVKSASELEALTRAGTAIDAVHARVVDWLRPERTERQVGADIADAIIAAGHARVDFVIVASGPNAASAHHELSDRVLRPGDAVVVDIGGTMPDGYCSDSTRTYHLGAPQESFAALYQVLRSAQHEAVAAVRPGVTCESIDARARDLIEAGGYGDLFIHRTGHGIGLDTHESPYIVAGNSEPLQQGHAFSVEPGIYRPGRDGARLEDIVVCGADGPVLLNRRPTDLIVVD